MNRTVTQVLTQPWSFFVFDDSGYISQTKQYQSSSESYKYCICLHMNWYPDYPYTYCLSSTWTTVTPTLDAPTVNLYKCSVTHISQWSNSLRLFTWCRTVTVSLHYDILEAFFHPHVLHSSPVISSTICVALLTWRPGVSSPCAKGYIELAFIFSFILLIITQFWIVQMTTPQTSRTIPQMSLSMIFGLALRWSLLIMVLSPPLPMRGIMKRSLTPALTHSLILTLLAILIGL